MSSICPWRLNEKFSTERLEHFLIKFHKTNCTDIAECSVRKILHRDGNGFKGKRSYLGSIVAFDNVYAAINCMTDLSTPYKGLSRRDRRQGLVSDPAPHPTSLLKHVPYPYTPAIQMHTIYVDIEEVVFIINILKLSHSARITTRGHACTRHSEAYQSSITSNLRILIRPILQKKQKNTRKQMSSS